MDSSKTIHVIDREKIKVDYLEGILYLDTTVGDVLQVYGVFSLEPFKVNPLGSVDLKVCDTGFYSNTNIPTTKHDLKLKYLSEIKVLFTVDNNLVLLFPDNPTYTLKVDGVPVKPNQYLFFKKGEIVCIECVPKTRELTNEYKIQDNTQVFLDLVGSDFNPTLSTFVRVNERTMSSNVFINVFRQMSEDVYNKQSPMLLKLF